MAFDDLLTQKCSILRLASDAKDNYGNKTSAFVPIATDVPCRVTQIKARVVEFRTDKKVSTDRVMVFLRSATDITEHDWLEIDGLRLDVLNVASQISQGASAHHLQVTCEAIKP